jgi:hypothetical protein
VTGSDVMVDVDRGSFRGSYVTYAMTSMSHVTFTSATPRFSLELKCGLNGKARY